MKGRLRYYFKQPKKSIAKDLLLWIIAAGAISIVGSSPYFLRALLRKWSGGKQYPLRSKEVAFYRMRKKGFLAVERKGHRYAVFLTKKGREETGWLQLNALAVKKQKKWNGEWHFLLFDIPQDDRWKRDILRSFLERLEFVLFQKSVWVHAYDPRAELEVLQKLLGLTSHDVKLMVVADTGLAEEDSCQLRKRFGL